LLRGVLHGVAERAGLLPVAAAATARGATTATARAPAAARRRSACAGGGRGAAARAVLGARVRRLGRASPAMADAHGAGAAREGAPVAAAAAAGGGRSPCAVPLPRSGRARARDSALAAERDVAPHGRHPHVLLDAGKAGEAGRDQRRRDDPDRHSRRSAESTKPAAKVEHITRIGWRVNTFVPSSGYLRRGGGT